MVSICTSDVVIASVHTLRISVWRVAENDYDYYPAHACWAGVKWLMLVSIYTHYIYQRVR